MDQDDNKKKLEEEGSVRSDFAQKRSETGPELENSPERDIEFEENLEDMAPEGANLSDKLKKIRAELKTCQTEKNDYLAGWQRAKADYLNLKREAEEHRTQTANWVKEGLFEELFPLADSFELAMGNKEIWEQAPENWRKGVEYIYLQLKNLLQNHGLEEIAPSKGEKFNPLEQHSVGVVPAKTADEDDQIDEIIKKGYKIKDRVLRPAQVRVKHWSKEN